MPQIDFACPGCALNCQLNEETRGLRHQEPSSECKVWTALRGDRQEFLRLAFLAQQGIATPVLRSNATPEPVHGAAALRLKE